MRYLLSLTFLVLFSGVCLAQLDAKLTTGSVDYNQGNFEQATHNLGLVMAQPNKLKKKNRAKGWLYLGKAAISKYNQEMQAYKKGDPVPDSRVVIQAMDAFQQGIKLNDEKQGENLLEELLKGKQLLLQLGLQYLNAGLSKDAIIFLRPAVKLNDGVIASPDHVTHDLLGQALLMEKDSAQAFDQFILGINLLEKTPPVRADVLSGYMSYRAALIKRYGHHDSEAALGLIRRGKALTEREWTRIGNGGTKQTGDLQTIEDQFRNTMADLKRFELDILINSGEHAEEALEKLKIASLESPEDYIIQVAYASLLERVDFQKAIAQYEKAIIVDDSEQMAHYNLAAIYVNQAVDISDQANNTSDLAEAQTLSKEVEALFELALPHMRKALAVKPDDLGALNALIQITVFLGLTDEYNTYVQQRKLLTGK